jgi:hypothetical protein
MVALATGNNLGHTVSCDAIAAIVVCATHLLDAACPAFPKASEPSIGKLLDRVFCSIAATARDF